MPPTVQGPPPMRTPHMMPPSGPMPPQMTQGMGSGPPPQPSNIGPPPLAGFVKPPQK